MTTINGTCSSSWRLRCSAISAILALAMTGCLQRQVAETEPETYNTFVKQNPSGGIDKIDVLFMIDNSLSMGDKQDVLKAAIPQLLRRLTNPDCVGGTGSSEVKTLPDPATACPSGLHREFAPVKDIHIGVVTSSMGDFGADSCPVPEDYPDGSHPELLANNDHAWLLGALPRNQGKLGSEFLAWGADDVQNYGDNIEKKLAEFGTFVSAASELGCGNEMSLESWYRFLIDPKPPTDVTSKRNEKGDPSGRNERGPVDQRILDQRKAFLRPDSLVAVFMVTDENDCSMRDDGYSWLPMLLAAKDGQVRMSRGSEICKTDPNNECCYSCLFGDAAPEKCKAMDPTCRPNEKIQLATADDNANVRCRQMKRRFGYDFLFPPSRYVTALTKKKLCPDQDYGDLDCECSEAKRKGIPCNPGAEIDNPLYVNLNPTVIPTGPMRDGPSSVFLAGVLGVPWQDLAVKKDAEVLEYRKAAELDWNQFAPKVDEDYSSATLGDPLMIESFEPRPGLPGPDSPRMANPINGHEWNTSKLDVQFACIFSLDVQLKQGTPKATRLCDLDKECPKSMGENSPEYKECTLRFKGCSCAADTRRDADGKVSGGPTDPSVTSSPLCQSASGEYGNTQYFAKAYPGLRQLQVLRGFYETTKSDNAIVGSICPKDLDFTHQSQPGYGYNPAVKALVDRLKEKLVGTCLPRKLDIIDGKVPCAIVEAIPTSADPKWCNCEDNQRATVNSQLDGAIRNAMKGEELCGGEGMPACSEFCLCKLNELTAGTDEGNKCLNELNVERSTKTPGFCYVDPKQDHGSAEVVSSCPGTEKRIIRIVGNANGTNAQLAAPAPGKVFIACTGAAYETEVTPVD